jgi:hypothetical protein
MDTSDRFLARSLPARTKLPGWIGAIALLFAIVPQVEAQVAIYHTEMWALSPGDNMRFNATGSARFPGYSVMVVYAPELGGQRGAPVKSG